MQDVNNNCLHSFTTQATTLERKMRLQRKAAFAKFRFLGLMFPCSNRATTARSLIRCGLLRTLTMKATD